MADFITYTLSAEANSAITRYIPVPYRCVVLGAKCVADYEAGNTTTVIINNGGTAQVTMTLAATSLAAVCIGVKSATTIYEAGTALKLDVIADADSAAGTITITIAIDPFLAGVAST